jgi:ribosomal protein S4
VDSVSITIPSLLYDTLGLVLSRSEAKRLLSQGAIEIDGQKVTSDVVKIRDGSTVKVGKRRFKKIVNADGQVSANDAVKLAVEKEGAASAEEYNGEAAPTQGQPRNIVNWLAGNQLVKSAEEAERLMAQGEILIVRENGTRHTVSQDVVTVMPGDVIKYGKRRFAKISDYNDKSIETEGIQEDAAKTEEAAISEYRIPFSELEDEALLAAAREACASDLIALKESIASEAGASEGASKFLVVTVPFILCRAGLAATQYDAKRLLARGAVKLDGVKIIKNLIAIKDGSIITTDKGRPVKIVNSDAKS